jgi:3-methyladenine DNA glycosylase AlkC
MAEPLKNSFGAEVPAKIAARISAVFPAFDVEAFVADALDGYEALELMPRGRRIAEALGRHLPADYPEAITILLASLGPKLEQTGDNGMAPFLYLPHTCFVARHGLDHFEVSMQAQHTLTQRFTAEFSIRPFLERHPQATLARLREWTGDPSAHVRRLVSEGTRPRLPWAPRLREFQKEPRPVLELLELLKDDPEPYVRRSVANNLNDIGKDHPSILVETSRRWMLDAGEDRRRLVRHALRSAIKRADPGALGVVGFGLAAEVSLHKAKVSPKRVAIGESVALGFEITNAETRPQRVLVDFRIHYVKANGETRPKVFKLKELDLGPGETAKLEKTVSLVQRTTRRHHPGRHRVEVVLNGCVHPLGAFELTRG